MLSKAKAFLSNLFCKKRQPTRIHDLTLIKGWEGLRLKAYQDTGGVWTIGYGHTATAKPGMKIDMDQAEALLRKDLTWVMQVLNSSVEVPLTQKQYDALASFVYNVGGTQFRNSTLLKKLNAGDYRGAADELPRWKYDNGKVIKGLMNRRAAEYKYFMDGTA